MEKTGGYIHGSPYPSQEALGTLEMLVWGVDVHSLIAEALEGSAISPYELQCLFSFFPTPLLMVSLLSVLRAASPTFLPATGQDRSLLALEMYYSPLWDLSHRMVWC